MTSSLRAPAGPGRAQYTDISGKAVGLLAALCGAFFLDAMDTSMVNVAIPDIDGALHLGNSLQWVVAGYILGYGGFLLVGGKLADILGRRRVFLAALAAFVAFSILGGLAWNGEVLIASRFLKGVAAAFTAPAALSLVTTSFASGSARTKALSIYTAVGSAGFTFGLVFGGLLTEIHWRAVFVAPGVLGSILLVLAVALVPQELPRAAGVERERINLAGAASITVAMMALVYALTQAPEDGWLSMQALTGFVLAAAAFLSFLVVERRHTHPLVPAGALNSWRVVRANLAAMAFVGSWAAAQYLATIYMQTTRGWSPLETSAAFLPCGILGLFIAPYFPQIVKRLTLLGTLAFGLALAVVCYALLQLVTTDTPYWVGMFPAFVLIGIAVILVYGAASVEATSDVPADLQGVASALLQTSIQFGSALLIAITTGVAVSAAEHGKSPMDSFQLGWLVPLVAVALMLVVTLAGISSNRRQSHVN